MVIWGFEGFEGLIIQSLEQLDELLVGLGEFIFAESEQLDTALGELAQLVDLAIGALQLLDNLFQLLHRAGVCKLFVLHQFIPIINCYF
jgi:hypothetical protein